MKTFSIMFNIIGKSQWMLGRKEEKVLKAKINAKGMQISIVSDGSYDDYISLTVIESIKVKIWLPQFKIGCEAAMLLNL